MVFIDYQTEYLKQNGARSDGKCKNILWLFGYFSLKNIQHSRSTPKRCVKREAGKAIVDSSEFFNF